MSNFQGHQERNPCQRSETIRHRSSWNIRRQRVTRREIRVNGLKLSPAKNTIRIYPGHQERNPCQRSETYNPITTLILLAERVTRREIRVNGLKRLSMYKDP